MSKERGSVDDQRWVAVLRLMSRVEVKYMPFFGNSFVFPGFRYRIIVCKNIKNIALPLEYKPFQKEIQ